MQSAVGADLAGKSVEMLANAIAEMRTYGEGFIIADQAPGLLDEAVIRNTNTKIILRLPDYADRQLVGKAIGLNDDQIDELSKLKQGVAAVYQNDWVEAVLCQVDRFEPEPAEDFSKNCGKPLPSLSSLQAATFMSSRLTDVSCMQSFPSRLSVSCLSMEKALRPTRQKSLPLSRTIS